MSTAQGMEGMGRIQKQETKMEIEIETSKMHWKKIKSGNRQTLAVAIVVVAIAGVVVGNSLWSLSTVDKRNMFLLRLLWLSTDISIVFVFMPLLAEKTAEKCSCVYKQINDYANTTEMRYAKGLRCCGQNFLWEFLWETYKNPHVLGQ